MIRRLTTDNPQDNLENALKMINRKARDFRMVEKAIRNTADAVGKVATVLENPKHTEGEERGALAVMFVRIMEEQKIRRAGNNACNNAVTAELKVKELREMYQAVKVIREICNSRTADDACFTCPFHEMCETAPYTWKIPEEDT